MIIGNICFYGHVFGQSGVQGFYGEPGEHKIQRIFRLLWGFTFFGIIFVAKTVTLCAKVFPISSNTELKGYKVKRWFPKSIWVSFHSFLKGYMLNTACLPNLGLERHLWYGKWQERKNPFQISISLMSNTLQGKIAEVRQICLLLLQYLPLSKHKYALQLNESCSNLGRDQKQDPSETIAVLEEFRRMIPELVIIVKYDLTVTPETIVAVKPYCSAFCIGNSLGFGKLMSGEWWKKYFPNGSPLAKYFGEKFPGALSGIPLFELLMQWLIKMERKDDSVVIIAGDGVFRKKDIERLSLIKIVHGVALGSVANLRPWRMHSLITYGNKIFRKRNL